MTYDLQSIVLNLYQHAPGFASRLQKAGLNPETIRSVEDLTPLPVIRKDDLTDFQTAVPPFGGFLACPVGDLKRIFQSPGPINDPESRVKDYWRWEIALRAAGFAVGDVVLNAFGYHLTPAGAMFEEGLWAIGCAVIPGGVGNQEQQIHLLHDLMVTGYVGLPSYLKALFDMAAEKGVSLSLEKAFVTAEPLPPSLRAELNQHGVTVRQGYGTAECGNLGYECELENGWHIPEDALIQVCDINTGQPNPPGETGEIVVTLYNPDYALVRFGTGDLSAFDPQPCSCGRKTARLMGWQGRVGDAVKVRGMFLHPRQLVDLMARFPDVTRWQAQISRREHKDHLTLRVIPAPECETATLPDRLIQTARQVIKFHLDVELLPGDSLPDSVPPLEDIRRWD